MGQHLQQKYLFYMFGCINIVYLSEQRDGNKALQLQTLHGSWITTNQGRQNVKHKGVNESPEIRMVVCIISSYVCTGK